jgi:glycosyltransferase involved in cell wall biosynthesis
VCSSDLKTYQDIPDIYKKNIILVDDSSSDKTVAIAKKLGLKVFIHTKNLCYGGNQKTCYKQALKLHPEIIIMIHPDYQYDPKLIPALVEMIRSGNYDCVLGSRILGGQALKGGMPCINISQTVFLPCLKIFVPVLSFRISYRLKSL